MYLILQMVKLTQQSAVVLDPGRSFLTVNETNKLV